MGRRSTSSTKSGKFMNPTDQASKYEPINKASSPHPPITFPFFISLANVRALTVYFTRLAGKEARKRELKKVKIFFKKSLDTTL